MEVLIIVFVNLCVGLLLYYHHISQVEETTERIEDLQQEVLQTNQLLQQVILQAKYQGWVDLEENEVFNESIDHGQKPTGAELGELLREAKERAKLHSRLN